jgi:hypothetical protein
LYPLSHDPAYVGDWLQGTEDQSSAPSHVFEAQYASMLCLHPLYRGDDDPKEQEIDSATAAALKTAHHRARFDRDTPRF